MDAELTVETSQDRKPALRLSPSQEMAIWLFELERRRGRPVRVLQIGNIANNGYLNCKFLRNAGLECHLLIRDYWHVMGLPEWEEADIEGDYGSDNQPDFSKADLKGYERPYWVVQGAFMECADEIERQLIDEPSDATDSLDPLRGASPRVDGPILTSLQQLVEEAAACLSKLDGVEEALRMAVQHAECLLGGEARVFQNPVDTTQFEEVADRCINLFDRAFPNREDRLTVNDITPYASTVSTWRRIFSHYDIVQCYATEPVVALLAGNVPYVSYEHGTIRGFTRGDVPLHRLTALAYWNAAHSFITNGDCLPIAAELALPSYSPTLHPIDVDKHEQVEDEAVAALRASIDADYILFCPLRHDWKIKGTDVHLRALPLIKRKLGKRVKLLCLAWGSQIDESKALIAELGCTHDIIWYGSLCRTKVIRFMKASDVVLDQISLPHFGATAPQAIAAGIPVVMSYMPWSTRFIVDEPAPILAAFTPEEVAACVVKATDADWRADFRKRARAWTYHQHHPNRIVHDHFKIYHKILEGNR